MALSKDLRPTSFDKLWGWENDTSLLDAFKAFHRSAEIGLVSTVKPGSLGIKPESFHTAFIAATNDPCRNEREARAFFETFFRPFLLMPNTHELSLLTGYYQPIHKASRVKTKRFQHPLYRRSDDLITVEVGQKLPNLPESFGFARRAAESEALVPYFSRQEIDEGALEGRGLEIAWLESRVDIFFIHVQGSSLLELENGEKLHVGYAAKSGHPFTGIGRYLINRGEIAEDQISMQTIRIWLEKNPTRMDEVLWQNRSYVFFRALEKQMHDGPQGASGANLIAGRSIAVDSHRHTWGTPAFIESRSHIEFRDGGTLPRLMIAQDTGSAIKGNCRADLYMGTGVEAGELAGALKENSSFHLLVPVAASERS